MSYAHAFRYAPTSATFRKAWPRMVADAARIVGYVHSTGVALRSRTGWAAPEFDQGSEGVIAFNGSARTRQDRDRFVIRPTIPDRRSDQMIASRYDTDGYVTRFCDTRRAPYDVAVTAVLLRCHLLAPTAFTISSEGDWDREWRHGAAVWSEDLIPPVAPPLAVAARTVIADLFGETPTRCPFTTSGPAEREPATAPATDKTTN
jgi:hypothetical protein